MPPQKTHCSCKYINLVVYSFIYLSQIIILHVIIGLSCLYSKYVITVCIGVFKRDFIMKCVMVDITAIISMHDYLYDYYNVSSDNSMLICL